MIKYIKVENFKSIKDASLKLPRFGAVMGRNGSGKTTLLSVISLIKGLASGLDSDVALSNIAPFGRELFYMGGPNFSCHFELGLDVEEKNYLLSFDLGVFNTAHRAVAIEAESLSRLDGENKTILYSRNRDKVYIYSSGKEEELPLKVGIGNLVLGTYSEPEVDKVSQIISNFQIVETHSENKKGLFIVRGDDPKMDMIDSVALSLYKKNGDTYKQAIESVKRIIPTFVSPMIQELGTQLEGKNTKQNESEAMKKYYVTWKEEAIPNSYSYLSLSAGNMRAIYLIFSLFNAEPNSFLGIEEIENGMHIERISKLLEEFRIQSSNRKVQVLFTTHSDRILEYITAQEVIHSSKTKDYGSKYQVITDTKEYDLIKTEFGKPEITGKDIFDSGLFK